MLAFYLPLAATSILMMVTHSVVSGAVSRTAFPALSLAAYSAAYSVGQVLESPSGVMQRMGLTFIKGKQSSKTVAATSLKIIGLVLGVYVLISWSPAVEWILKKALGVTDDIYPFAVSSLRVFLLWPTFTGIRALFQPRIVLARKTFWMSVNMLCRVGVMVLLALFLPKALPTGPVGAIILVAGIGAEAFLALFVVRWALPPIADEPSGDVPVASKDLLRFFSPISLAVLVQTLGKPILTASLMRTLNPTIALAGYQVAASFSCIFVALTYNIYHVVVVYVKDDESYRKMQWFCLGLGAIGSVMTALCCIPSVGRLVFGGVIGAPPDVTREAVLTLTVLILFPITSAFMEFFGGILMLGRRASQVTFGKIANMASTCVIAIALVAAFPGIGGIAAAVAITVGPAIEAGIAYAFLRRDPHRHYGEPSPEPQKETAL